VIFLKCKSKNINVSDFDTKAKLYGNNLSIIQVAMNPLINNINCFSPLFVYFIVKARFTFFFVKTYLSLTNQSLKALIFLQNLRTFAPSKFNISKLCRNEAFSKEKWNAVSD